MRRGRAAAFALLAVCPAATPVLSGPLHGQRITAAVTGSWTEHRVEAGLGTEVSTGPSVTLGAAMRLGTKLHVAAEGMVGKLTPDGVGEERDVSEVSLAVRYDLLRWLSLETSATARGYTAPIATQHWTIARIGAEARLPLGSGRFTGVGRVAFLPIVDVNGLSAPEQTIAAAAAIEYDPGRLAFRLQYQLERYDFPPQGAVTRLEQLTGVALRVSYGIL